MSILSAMKGANNSWANVTSDFFEGIGYLGPKNLVDNRSHEMMISASNLKESYVFTKSDVKSLDLLYGTSEWIKFRINFNDGKSAIATFMALDRSQNAIKPSNNLLTFEFWMSGVIYSTIKHEPSNTETAEDEQTRLVYAENVYIQSEDLESPILSNSTDSNLTIEQKNTLLEPIEEKLSGTYTSAPLEVENSKITSILPNAEGDQVASIASKAEGDQIASVATKVESDQIASVATKVESKQTVNDTFKTKKESELGDFGITIGELKPARETSYRPQNIPEKDTSKCKLVYNSLPFIIITAALIVLFILVIVFAIKANNNEKKDSRDNG